MTLEDFLDNVNTYERPSDDLTGALKALWYAEKGNWEKAHSIAQDEPGKAGSWVHAYLHREEGDNGNAGYWYRQAGKPESSVTLKEERHAIITTLLQEVE